MIKIVFNKTTIGLLVLFIYLIPNIFLQEEARYLVHDNLDSNVVWYKVLAESGSFFSSSLTEIPNILGGIPRGCYPSEFNLLHILYLLFSPLMAYNINIILIHIIAFLGMLFLLRDYVFHKKDDFFAIGISLVFAMLPFWPSGGISIAGQPLLIWALFNIYNGKKYWLNWFIVIAFPFYSSLILSNLFFIPVLSVVFVGLFFKHKKINWHVIIALSLFVLASVIESYRLFEMEFFRDFESHRTEFEPQGKLNINGVIGSVILLFVKGHYHFHSFHWYILLLVPLFLILSYAQKNNLIKVKIVLILIGFSLFISLIHMFKSWEHYNVLSQKFYLLKILNIRFISLYPLIWHLVFAIMVSELIKYKFLKIASYAIITLAIVFSFTNFILTDYMGSKYVENSFFYTVFKNYDKSSNQTFNDYYEKKIFDRLDINNFRNGKIACLGINPAKVQFNSLYTIDGYFGYYPLQRKKQLKAIIEDELSKSTIRKAKFDKLGQRAYLFAFELNDNHRAERINLPEWNYQKLKMLGCKYIFSTVQFQINGDDIPIKLSHDINENNKWLYIYEIL
jgi:hypothetical protein